MPRWPARRVIGAIVLAVSLTARPSAAPADPFVGSWVLNDELSDRAQPASESGRGRGGRSDGRRGRGGIGGGFGRGGGRGGRGQAEPDERRLRQMEAVREVLDAPRRLVIAATDSMVIVTTDQARTTRLLADGTPVKDESTNVTRTTRWVGGMLECQLSGLTIGKARETYAVDPTGRRLTITVSVERLPGRPGRGPEREAPRREGETQPQDGADAKGPRTFTRVYDRDPVP